MKLRNRNGDFTINKIATLCDSLSFFIRMNKQIWLFGLKTKASILNFGNLAVCGGWLCLRIPTRSKVEMKQSIGFNKKWATIPISKSIELNPIYHWMLLIPFRVLTHSPNTPLIQKLLNRLANFNLKPSTPVRRGDRTEGTQWTRLWNLTITNRPPLSAIASVWRWLNTKNWKGVFHHSLSRSREWFPSSLRT